VTKQVLQITEGSNLYYALWGVEDTVRHRCIARLALGRALEDALLDVTTPEVAHQKLHWWHEELDRLHDGKARHPETVACADLAGDPAAREAALNILGAAADERYTPAETTEQLNDYVVRGSHSLAALVLAGLEHKPVQALVEPLAPLAEGLALHDRLARLPRLLAAGQPVFATDLYTQHELDAADLAQTTDAAKLNASQALIAEATANARNRLETGINQASGVLVRDHAARPVFVLAHLRLRQLDAWAKRGTLLSREYFTLPPLSKLWTAWRHR
jgi:phytoene synthase